MKAFTHPRPLAPAHMRTRSGQFQVLDSALRSALLGRTADALGRAEDLSRELAAEMHRPLTVAEREAEDRYRIEVAKYNEAVDAHNAAVRAERQARVNARETQKVRAARCETCFCVHPGEC
jgi:uncharacterized protein YukE